MIVLATEARYINQNHGFIAQSDVRDGNTALLVENHRYFNQRSIEQVLIIAFSKYPVAGDIPTISDIVLVGLSEVGTVPYRCMHRSRHCPLPLEPPQSLESP